MNQSLQDIVIGSQGFTWLGLLSLAVAIAVAVGLTRKVFTFFLPALVPVRTYNVGTKTYTTKYLCTWSRFYNELFLYFLPYLWALVYAFIRSEFIYGKISTYGGRLLLAILVATFSATVFKAAKKSIPKLFGVEVKCADDVDDVGVEVKCADDVDDVGCDETACKELPTDNT